ncbi:acetyltransferase [Thioalkalivibrio paradoxus]|uniref:Transferase n=1 Tax=Thioalkalivibrio paradoxus ARh 1 TaxID=713585 RepID=W0DL61_9GAMM|nr:acetyltransferase [Thioalkalivibrio paradoxus]AHE99166.1 transferase [Thioalkalivibrio paradoxus ARh 1]
MNRLVIYGNGQVAELALARLRRDTQYELAACTVDRDLIQSQRFQGLPVIPFDEIEQHYPPDSHRMLVAVGHTGVNRIRAERFNLARAKGYRFIRLISPRADVWPDVELGENCMIGDGCIVLPFSRLGDNVHLGTGCTIGHHVTIGDHSSLAMNVVVAGSVQIESGAFLGAGVTVRDRITVGTGAFLGAGVVLQSDAAPKSVYAAPEPRLLPIASDKLPGLS